MHKFKCPVCRCPCDYNPKLSEVKGKPENERIYVYVCNGQKSKQTPHGPIVWREQIESVVLDQFGRVQNKISKLTRIAIEDAEMHELLDEFKDYMREQRYKRLPMSAQAEG